MVRNPFCAELSSGQTKLLDSELNLAAGPTWSALIRAIDSERTKNTGNYNALVFDSQQTRLIGNEEGKAFSIELGNQSLADSVINIANLPSNISDEIAMIGTNDGRIWRIKRNGYSTVQVSDRLSDFVIQVIDEKPVLIISTGSALKAIAFGE